MACRQMSDVEDICGKTSALVPVIVQILIRRPLSRVTRTRLGKFLEIAATIQASTELRRRLEGKS